MRGDSKVLYPRRRLVRRRRRPFWNPSQRRFLLLLPTRQRILRLQHPQLRFVHSLRCRVRRSVTLSRASAQSG